MPSPTFLNLNVPERVSTAVVLPKSKKFVSNWIFGMPLAVEDVPDCGDSAWVAASRDDVKVKAQINPMQERSLANYSNNFIGYRSLIGQFACINTDFFNQPTISRQRLRLSCHRVSRPCDEMYSRGRVQSCCVDSPASRLANG